MRSERKDQSEREHMMQVWAWIPQDAECAAEVAREARGHASSAAAELQTLSTTILI